jgi:nucleotide-binding universal stress UspA family protein
MNYQHVLVPIDLINPDPIAIDAAFDLAMQNHAKITLLHIIESIHESEVERDEEIDQFYAELETSVREKLTQLAKRFKDAQLTVHHEIVVGRPVRDIVRYSATHSVDLIVLRSDRVDPARPQEAMTKVSYHISMFCQCPVMLVKSVPAA